MTRLFIDTGIWLAACLPGDPSHGAARAVLDGVVRRDWQTVHTSDHVVAETLNFIRKKIKRREVAEVFLAHVFGTADIPPLVTSVLRVHSGRFAAAIERYRHAFDRGLSFTDWTSVVVMEEEAISTLATLDGDFHGLVPDVLKV